MKSFDVSTLRSFAREMADNGRPMSAEELRNIADRLEGLEQLQTAPTEAENAALCKMLNTISAAIAKPGVVLTDVERNIAVNAIEEAVRELSAPSEAEQVVEAELPLRCFVDGNQVVFRIGINTLVWAAEHCPKLHDGERHSEPPYIKVVDALSLAGDVVAEVNREEEDGSTPLHLMLDNAIFNACENGSIGFDYEALASAVQAKEETEPNRQGPNPSSNFRCTDCGAVLYSKGDDDPKGPVFSDNGTGWCWRCFNKKVEADQKAEPGRTDETEREE